MGPEEQEQDARWLRDLIVAFDDRVSAGLRARMNKAIPEFAREHGLDEAKTSALLGHNVNLGPDSLLGVIFDDAIKRLPGSLKQPEELYFVQIGAPTLNGFALKAPSGGPVIVLNHGLISYVGHAMHVVLGLTSMEPPVYCPHHPSEAFLNDLFTLADGLVAGVPALLLPLHTMSCLDTDHHRSNDVVHHGSCLLAEYFIVFHELGHALLGHLDPGRSRRVVIDALATGVDRVEKLEPAQQDEIDADLFAYEQIVELAAGELLPRDVAYAVGCLFVLMHVVERTSDRTVCDSHPPASARWSRIRKLLPPDETHSWAVSIDYLFDYLGDASSLRPDGI